MSWKYNCNHYEQLLQRIDVVAAFVINNEPMINISDACRIFDILTSFKDGGKLTLHQIYDGLMNNPLVIEVLNLQPQRSSLNILRDTTQCPSLLRRIAVYDDNSLIDKDIWIDFIGNMILNDIEYLRLKGLTSYQAFWGRGLRDINDAKRELLHDLFPPTSLIDDFIYYERNHHPLLSLTFYADVKKPIANHNILLIEFVIHVACIFYSTGTFLGPNILYVSILYQLILVGLPLILIRHLYQRIFICTNKAYPKQHIFYAANGNEYNSFKVESTKVEVHCDELRRNSGGSGSGCWGCGCLVDCDCTYCDWNSCSGCNNDHNEKFIINETNRHRKRFLSVILVCCAAICIAETVRLLMETPLKNKLSYLAYTFFVLYSLFQINFLEIMVSFCIIFFPFPWIRVCRKVCCCKPFMTCFVFGRWMMQRELVLQYLLDHEVMVSAEKMNCLSNARDEEEQEDPFSTKTSSSITMGRLLLP